MPQRILALEINDTEAKAAVIETTFRDYRVAGLYREPLSAVDGPIEEQLRRFVEKHGGNADTILSALPGHRVTWRTFFLPFRDAKRLAQTVPFELESNVPFGLDEVVVDYHILHRDRAGTTVLAALVPKEGLERHLEMLQKAGADPKIVDVGPLATLNILSLVPDLPPTFIYIDVGAGSTTVALYREGSLVGLRSLLHAAATASTNGTGGGTHGEQSLSVLVGDLRWSLLALNGAPLDDEMPCYLAGEAAAVDALRGRLEESLQVRVRRLDQVRLRSVDAAAASRAPDFTSSIGLALREVLPANAIGVNFRRGEFTFHRSQQELQRALRGVAALGALVVALTVGDLYMEYRQLATRAAQLDQQVQIVFRDALPDVRATNPVVQLQDEVNALSDRVALLNDIVPVSTSTSVDILRAVASAVPTKIRIDSEEYSMDPDQVRLRGNTETYESVDAIKQEILNTGFFSDVVVKEAKVSKDGGVNFRMNLEISKNLRMREEHG
jgi:general secretion pathway protein L